MGDTKDHNQARGNAHPTQARSSTHARMTRTHTQTSADACATHADAQNPKCAPKGPFTHAIFHAILVRFCVQNLPQPTPHGFLVA